MRRDPATCSGALKRIVDQLGVHPETLRTWVKRAEIERETAAASVHWSSNRLHSALDHLIAYEDRYHQQTTSGEVA
ncbi:hypothetical protein Rhow_000810 [Rhodococcus wratislaviensis]|uniref:Transposase n=1 Tax=Rhodococcus wratislaviensis TaxID=44752 RepID=A0A402C2V0_RHOWR|nr:hypothetical protein Rhow_000810 [Rhodococcus wratislaviensis]